MFGGHHVVVVGMQHLRNVVFNATPKIYFCANGIELDLLLSQEWCEVNNNTPKF